jgi:hypothetical protein
MSAAITTAPAPANTGFASRHASNATGTHSTIARMLNAFLTPSFGISTKPVNKTPATAPNVFQVSNRPTRLPRSFPSPDTSRMHNGRIAPINPAGIPRMIIENPPAMI